MAIYLKIKGINKGIKIINLRCFFATKASLRNISALKLA